MSLTLDIVIPVKDLADQVARCVEPLAAQLHEGDRIVVVDDASTDGTGAAARAAGAEVLALASSRGPYFARQVAASRSTAAALIFIDGRCRPLPGLLDSHRALLARDGVALSCTDVRTLSGDSLAARIAAIQQPFSLTGYVGVPGRLDFFPTANLGVIRSAFVAVGGFREMRSGADADLCWRIQQAGLGSLAADPTVHMEWAPRSTMRSLLEQWNRYGRSTAYLEWVHPEQSPTATGRRVSLKNELAKRALAVAALAPSAAYLAGLRQGRRATMVAPKPYENPS